MDSYGNDARGTTATSIDAGGGPAPSILDSETASGAEGTSAARPRTRKVAAASFVGTSIEFYDFYIYGTAAALVFPTVFFPALGSTAGIVASFATFGVAFFARPVGALIFGHFGDRLGRKKTLVVTLLMMGLSTVAVGLVPSADSIGVVAPILLVLLRLLQGFAVGGEWAGAALLSAEHAPSQRRGFFGMFTQLGAPMGYVLSSLTFLITSLTFGDTSSAFLDWGWRVPFLLSAVLIVVGLVIRLKVEETPVFAATVSHHEVVRAPLSLLLRTQLKQVLIAGGAITATFGMVFMATTYLTSYGTGVLGLTRSGVLATGIVGGLAFAASTAISAALSDRVGRRPLMLGGFAVGVGWTLLLFPILDQGTQWAFTSSVVVTFIVIGVSYGPMGSLLPELFDTRCRYSGAGLSYNLGGILGGAVPPLIAGPLASSYGSLTIGILLAVLCAISLGCVAAMQETQRIRLTEPVAQ